VKVTHDIGGGGYRCSRRWRWERDAVVSARARCVNQSKQVLTKPRMGNKEKSHPSTSTTTETETEGLAGPAGCAIYNKHTI